METITLSNTETETTNHNNTTDFLMLTNYDTFLDVKHTKNNSVFILDEESLKAFQNNLQEKIGKYSFLYYTMMLIEVLFQIILIKYFSPHAKSLPSFLSQFFFLIIFFLFSIIIIIFHNIYTITLFEGYICFICAMNIWITGVNFELIFYILENIGNYLMVKNAIAYKEELEKILC